MRVVAVGTGQALKNAENGDGDVVLVHAKPDEEKFVAEGWGVKRQDVMYNDFVIVGPAADPAKIAGLKDAGRRLQEDCRRPRRHSRRAATTQRHATRPRSTCGRTPASTPRPLAANGTVHRLRHGRRPSIRRSGNSAYALTDRGTWLSFTNQDRFKVLVEGDPKRVQPIRRHPGQPGQASQRQSERGTGLHRLADRF